MSAKSAAEIERDFFFFFVLGCLDGLHGGAAALDWVRPAPRSPNFGGLRLVEHLLRV